MITFSIIYPSYNRKRFYILGYLQQWRWNRWRIQRNQWNPGNIITMSFYFIETTTELLHSQ